MKIAKSKYNANLYKIFNLTPLQATILKQTALACATDCAVHRDVLTHNIDFSDAILFATNKQLKEIIKKLYSQPFNLKTLAQNLENSSKKLEPININNHTFDWGKTYIMGILNITPNSFSDGGEYIEEEKAIIKFNELVEQGADIIDIGAESTAPTSSAISSDEEISRLKNMFKKLKAQNSNIITSIDTRNAKTANFALKNGVNIINDISGFTYDKDMAKTVAKYDVTSILTFNDSIEKENTVDSTIKGLIKRIELATEAGISQNKIVLDVGLGFNKTYEQNIELIKRADEICSLGYPVLYGLSRKSFVQKMSNMAAKETLAANISLASYLAEKGVNIIRVHDVLEHKIALGALDKIIYD